jgi:hypothetical protein
MTDLPESVNRAELIKWLNETGGYGILLPDFFTKKLGLPEEMVARFARNHQGGEGKHAIQSNDGQENAAYGVSEFEIIEAIASAVGVEPCSMYYGRGKNFHMTCSMVLKALQT